MKMLVEYWTLVGEEFEQVAGKRGPTRPGFDLLLKFYSRHGRFPRGRGQLSAHGRFPFQRVRTMLLVVSARETGFANAGCAEKLRCELPGGARSRRAEELEVATAHG
jgi:hypothetical protein